MTGVSDPKLNAGLSLYEQDYYAILGVPICADASTIRKGYIKVAKSLHPDRYIGQPGLREMANWLFSKLISPANDMLNRERERIEYREILRLHVKQLLGRPPSEIWPRSDLANSLHGVEDLDAKYTTLVSKASKDQYLDLDRAIERTEVLSEINLAYLLLSGGYKMASPPGVSSNRTKPPSTPQTSTTAKASAKPSQPPTRPPSSPVSKPPASPASPPKTSSSGMNKSVRAQPTATSSSSAKASAPQPPNSTSQPTKPPANPTDQRYKQARQMIERGQFMDAVRFLNIAITSAPNRPELYLERGLAYRMQNSTARARQDFKKVLSLDPDNAEAKQHLRTLDRNRTDSSRSTSSAQQASSPARSSGQASTPADSNKGFLGRLFNR